MRFPLILTYHMSKYLMTKKMVGQKRFPLVLMLEPLHACNLACVGCGRIREYEETIDRKMSLEESLKAVDDCGAPVVSICGGEPLMHPDIIEMTNEIIKRKRHIYFCTNGIMLPRMIDKFTPSDYLYFNIHIDGTEEIHDLIADKKGTYQKAIDAVKACKDKGFKVCTNTTVYNETDVNDVLELFETLTDMDIDGILVSPGYEYESVDEKTHFLNKQEIHDKFKIIDEHSHKYKFYSTPIYMKFLRGEKELECTPWGNVTYNTSGWKAPCYLITDGHYDDYNEFMEKVDWESFGPGKDPRCTNCMVHSGFEATVARGVNNTFSETLELAKWQFS